ncbi:MAG: hypothetical protein NVS3B12_01150 [Acidimicrobiales bacterium]
MLLCAGMLVIPLAALSTGGGTGRSTRVAAQPAPTIPSATAEATGAADPAPMVDGPVQVETAAAAPSAPAVTPTVLPTTTPLRSARAASVAPGVVPRPSASAASSVTSAQPKSPPTTRTQPTAAPSAPAGTQHSQSGPASYYDEAPSGTCAHPTLPFGTVVSIVDTDNGSTASCTVEDRGPYAGGRIIDLARDVFTRMAPTSAGVINVRISW